MLRLLLTLAIVGLAAPARAGGVVALSDGRVAQYQEALAAAKEVVKDAPVLDPNAGDVADQLRHLEPQVVLAIGQKALQVARAATPSVPTVYCMVLSAGAAAARNVTGVRLEVAPQAQLEQFQKVHPGAHRVGVIYEPRQSAAFVEEAVKAAGRQGVTLVSRPVQDAKEVRPALEEISGGIDALWLPQDPRLITAEMFNYLLVYTLERKIALFGFLDSSTKAGALASVAPDYPEIGRRAARLAVEVSQKPGAPVPPPSGSPGALTVNLRTAKQLGIEVSQGVLGKARQVYR
jgi:putative ABC transport system substrate-binding protein